jgi:RNA polymerase sigma-70 factor (ECF subfamily)
MADDLNSIVQGCRAGDRAARRLLYERFHRSLYRLAARLVGTQEAADLTQEIFLRVFTRIASFQGTAAFSTWMYRVALNECLRHLRGRPRRPQPLAEEPAGREAGPDRPLEVADQLDHALSCLEPNLRAIFWLREADGLSYSEIADVLSIPSGTVASQLSRARAELQNYVRQIEPESQP